MKEEPLELRVFILDSRVGGEIARWFEEIIPRRRRDAEKMPDLKIATEVETRHLWDIPDGYDLYLLHLSDLKGDDFKHLKERNSCSRVLGISNGGDAELKVDIDGNYFHVLYHSRVFFLPNEAERQISILLGEEA